MERCTNAEFCPLNTLHRSHNANSRQTLDRIQPMAALNNEIKAFVAQALACFDSPSQVPPRSGLSNASTVT